jgi:hypothetical protein
MRLVNIFDDTFDGISATEKAIFDDTFDGISATEKAIFDDTFDGISATTSATPPMGSSSPLTTPVLLFPPIPPYTLPPENRNTEEKLHQKLQ